jgi:hypothetical protein
MVFGTQQKLLLGGGRKDFVIFHKIHRKIVYLDKETNNFVTTTQILLEANVSG